MIGTNLVKCVKDILDPENPITIEDVEIIFSNENFYSPTGAFYHHKEDFSEYLADDVIHVINELWPKVINLGSKYSSKKSLQCYLEVLIRVFYQKLQMIIFQILLLIQLILLAMIKILLQMIIK